MLRTNMFMRTPAFIVVTGAFVLLLTSRVPTAAVDENWPQWRGPEGLGVAAGTNYPEEWTLEKNVAWKIPVEGSGHSSPVIWGNSLFITTAIQGEHVPGRTAPDHLDFNLKPGYLHPDAAGVRSLCGRSRPDAVGRRLSEALRRIRPFQPVA